MPCAGIVELNSDKHSEGIVRTVASLASNLGMRVIAEGVETQAQVDALKAVVEVEFQGYYFSRPLDVANLMNWQRQHGAVKRC